MEKNVLKGLVIKSTGSWFNVFLNGNLYPCKLKGKLRLNSIKATNPVAVGDWVYFVWDENARNGVIEAIDTRKNYMIRKATNLSKQVHVLAANIDQAILVASLVLPRISQGFIDRFLVTAEAYQIQPLLVFNKVDLLNETLTEILEEIITEYESIGYTCLKTSATLGLGIEQLEEKLQNKVSLVSGFSGVGKSSLINEISPNSDQKTGVISDYSQKGKHTTTFAEMFFLNENSKIIDTPGIKELGVIDVEDYELSHFFPEMKDVLSGCRFNNCLHTKEPGCAVKSYVEIGKISQSRYNSYLSILNNEDQYR